MTERREGSMKPLSKRRARLRICWTAAALLVVVLYHTALKQGPHSSDHSNVRRIGKRNHDVNEPHHAPRCLNETISSGRQSSKGLGVGRRPPRRQYGTSNHKNSSSSNSDPITCGEHVKSKYDCAAKGCTDKVSGFLNYVMIYECYWSDLKPLVWICFILWLLFLLYMLANTADAFFCPSLEVIVDILRVSPDIAGVTFLSFGNGAPDVFSSLAAYVAGQGEVGISAILGAGVFVTTLVVGVVCLVSEVQLSKGFFLRDVIFYMLAIIYLIVSFLLDVLTIGQSIGFIVMYIIYAIVATSGRRLSRWFFAKKDKGGFQLLEENERDVNYELDLDEIANCNTENKWEPPSCSDVTLSNSAISASSAASPGTKSVQKKKRNSAILPRHVERAPNTNKLVQNEHSNSWITTPRKKRSYSDEWEFSLTHKDLNKLIEDGGQLHRREWSGVLSEHDNRVESVAKSTKKTQLSLSIPDCDPFQQRGRFLSVQPDYGALRAFGRSKKRMGLKDISRRRLIHNRHLFNSTHKWVEHLIGSLDVDPIEEQQIFQRTLSQRSDTRESCYVEINDDTHQSGTLGSIQEKDENDSVEQESCFTKYFGPDSFIDRFMYYFLLPATVIRRITIPVVEKEDYDWKWVTVTPIFGLPWVFLTVLGIVGETTVSFVQPVGHHTAGLSWAVLSFTLGIISSIILYLLLKHGQYPRGITLVVLTLLSFLSSVCWVINVANEIVTLLATIGLFIGISPSLLAMTILAWGNSLGDLVADVTVAKEGIPSMAIAAAYAGPCFNLLIGLGLSTSVAIWRHGSLDLQPRQRNGEIDQHSVNVVYCNFAFLLAALVFALVSVPLAGYRMTRRFGISLILLYIVYFSVSIVLQYEK